MQAAKWRESEFRGTASVVGESESIRVEIIPSRGGKVISFINKESGKEWVYQNEEPWNELKYGMLFDEGDRSGWDEMFPTILPCPCPDHPWTHAVYPDHGEVWTLPWQAEINDGYVRMKVHGVQVPYIFMKTYFLSGKQLTVKYEVHNPTPFAMSYMWCAHNLLAVEEGMKLALDPRLNAIQYQYSHQNRMTPNPYGRSSYPLVRTDSSEIDLSVIEAKESKHAEKFWFETELESGIAGLYNPQTGDSLTYLFSPDDVPYLAVWANYGAFWNDYNMALEPATGFLDDVYVASLMKKVKKVQPYSVNRWDFVISIDKHAL